MQTFDYNKINVATATFKEQLNWIIFKIIFPDFHKMSSKLAVQVFF